MKKVNFDALKNIKAPEELIARTLAAAEQSEPAADFAVVRRHGTPKRILAAAASIVLVLGLSITLYFYTRKIDSLPAPVAPPDAPPFSMTEATVPGGDVTPTQPPEPSAGMDPTVTPTEPSPVQPTQEGRVQPTNLPPSPSDAAVPPEPTSVQPTLPTPPVPTAVPVEPTVPQLPDEPTDPPEPWEPVEPSEAMIDPSAEPEPWIPIEPTDPLPPIEEPTFPDEPTLPVPGVEPTVTVYGYVTPERLTGGGKVYCTLYNSRGQNMDSGDSFSFLHEAEITYRSKSSVRFAYDVPEAMTPYSDTYTCVFYDEDGETVYTVTKRIDVD